MNIEHKVLNFINYRVKKLEFVLNENYKPSKQGVDIQPKLEKSVRDIAPEQFEIVLSFSIESNDSFPFSIFVELAGLFSAKTSTIEDKSIAYKKAAAILFPYLRSIVSAITVQTGIPPLIIPVVNIEKLFEEEKS